MAAVIGARVDAERAPLSTVLETLEGDVEKLSCMANKLADQLAPLLADVPEKADMPDNPSPGLSPLVVLINDIHDRLGRVQWRLQSISNRLEVG
jgi:hypothetical protein